MKKGYKKSPVLMKSIFGDTKLFDSIQSAAEYANANSWTMSVKMEVFGYFEDKNGNKYYRQDKMNTKNNYQSSSPTIIKEQKKKRHRKESYNKKAVIVDGVRYESISDAEAKLGVKKDTFGQALRAKRYRSLGYSICYADEQKSENNLKNTEEKENITIDTEDPVIKLLNEQLVKILKEAKVYDKVKKLSEAIKLLSNKGE